MSCCSLVAIIFRPILKCPKLGLFCPIPDTYLMFSITYWLCSHKEIHPTALHMSAGNWRFRLANPSITLFLQLQCQVLAPRPYNSPFGEHMDKVRDNVIQQTLVMGDDNYGPFRRPQRVHPVGDDLQGIDVQT